LQPFFFNSTAGQLFGNYFPATDDCEAKGDILFFPPFAEELNRSRHMISRQARAFNRLGYGVLLVDLFGTGDSAGSYAESSWEIWIQDMKTACDWLVNQKSRPIAFWALRSGALLAADLVQRYPQLACHLLLWAPVSQGKAFISQFLRIKIAADLAETTTGTKDSDETENAPLGTRDMLALLHQGHTLEIAGYHLPPALALPLLEMSLTSFALPPETRIDWFDVSPSQTAGISPAARRAIEGWHKQGLDATAHSVKDVQFWALQEPEWAKNLIEETSKVMMEMTDLSEVAS
tara:strand:+ start:5519 stop:6391 length:873 start_codon:yes stop_codon:yes gene_type:complete